MEQLSNQEKIQILQEVADELDGDFRQDYSGRGMYGDTCCGIVVDYLVTGIEELAARGLKGASHDNMGRGWIIYYQDIQWEEE